jgi:hypothetical protein
VYKELFTTLKIVPERLTSFLHVFKSFLKRKRKKEKKRKQNEKQIKEENIVKSQCLHDVTDQMTLFI